MINFDQTAISKRIAKGTKEIALIETTSLCKGNAISFTHAMDIAEVQLLQENNFLLSLDVKMPEHTEFLLYRFYHRNNLK